MKLGSLGVAGQPTQLRLPPWKCTKPRMPGFLQGPGIQLQRELGAHYARAYAGVMRGTRL